MKTTLFDTTEIYNSIPEEGADLDEVNDKLAWSWGDLIGSLDIDLDGSIVIVADLGRWDGRHEGFLVTDTNNVGDAVDNIRFCGDSQEVFVSDGELMIRDTHHDGTNYYRVRVMNTEDYDEDEAYSTEDIMKMTIPIGDKVLGC